MPDKYEVKKVHKNLYAPPKTDFVLVTVPPLTYLAVDGHGDPNTSTAYKEALEALYGLSFTTKFASKKQLNRDYAVGPLEGLWRAGDLCAFTDGDKAAWDWTMLIWLPEWIDEAFLEESRAVLAAKKNPVALPLVHRLALDEGLSAQILHIGSYDDEAPTLARLHNEYMPAHGLTFNGDHHEIYLGDPRRTAPEKLKTVLRQPVRAL